MKWVHITSGQNCQNWINSLCNVNNNIIVSALRLVHGHQFKLKRDTQWLIDWLYFIWLLCIKGFRANFITAHSLAIYTP